MNTVCGIDCSECPQKETCGGCKEKECTVLKCSSEKGFESCEECGGRCSLRERLIEEINALGIEDMEKLTSLNSLLGSYVNLEYTLPSGQKIKFWDDKKIYLGNQICKKGSHRSYGICADENHILICEYGSEGADPEIVLYKKR